MFYGLLKVNDVVIVTIPKVNRDWGYNPCPDGTKATIIGFSEIDYGRVNNFGRKPGIYVNCSWVNLRFEDGREHLESSSRVELVDKVGCESRLTEFRKFQQDNLDNQSIKEFLRELPKTPFWEGDIVRVSGLTTCKQIPGYGKNVFRVIRIDYMSIDRKTAHKKKWLAYDISDNLGSGWNMSASEDQMYLIERGLVWKYYHNNPIKFYNIEEEARFFSLLGHTDDVRNPANGLYKWTKEDILDAIKKGLVHGFSVSSGFFGGKPQINAQRFRDEDLGKRVAVATLKGFEITT